MRTLNANGAVQSQAMLLDLEKIRACVIRPGVSRGSTIWHSCCHSLVVVSESSPGNNKPEVGDGKDLATGKRYYDGLCAFCHGPRGEGNEQHATPFLQRQHYSYLLMQSRRLAMGHCYSVPIEVMEVLQKLPLDKLTAVCDYASRLPDVAIAIADATNVESEHEPSDP